MNRKALRALAAREKQRRNHKVVAPTGQRTMSVGVANGKLHMKFSAPTNVAYFDYQQAVALCQRLMELTDQISPGRQAALQSIAKKIGLTEEKQAEILETSDADSGDEARG